MTELSKLLNTKGMIVTALFAALCAAGAFVKIYVGTVPITLQLLFTTLAGLLLGKDRGLISVALYLFIGLAGVPVFAGGGGLSYLLQPSIGYLIGMMLGAYVAGAIYEKGQGSARSLILACAANMVIVYLFGLLFLHLITSYYIKAPMSLNALFVSGCLVFIPGDILCCAASAVLAKRLKPRLVQYLN